MGQQPQHQSTTSQADPATKDETQCDETSTQSSDLVDKFGGVSLDAPDSDDSRNCPEPEQPSLETQRELEQRVDESAMQTTQPVDAGNHDAGPSSQISREPTEESGKCSEDDTEGTYRFERLNRDSKRDIYKAKWLQALEQIKILESQIYDLRNESATTGRPEDTESAGRTEEALHMESDCEARLRDQQELAADLQSRLDTQNELVEGMQKRIDELQRGENAEASDDAIPALIPSGNQAEASDDGMQAMILSGNQAQTRIRDLEQEKRYHDRLVHGLLERVKELMDIDDFAVRDLLAEAKHRLNSESESEEKEEQQNGLDMTFAAEIGDEEDNANQEQVETVSDESEGKPESSASPSVSKDGEAAD